MKTSLILDDQLFEDAKKEAAKSGRTISDVVSDWARLGRQAWKESNRTRAKEFRPVNLGRPTVDLTNRKYWMDDLDDRD